MHIARRTITRPAQAGGEVHEALSDAQWQASCDAGGFALHWHANGLAYGVRPARTAGVGGRPGAAQRLTGRVACDSRTGAALPRDPGSPRASSCSRERLQARGREDTQAIEARLKRDAPVQADFSVANDGTVAECVAALMAWWDEARLNL